MQSPGELGHRVRAYRLRRRMSLRELAERADVSASFLSQLERGRSSASIASLARIAGGLSIAIADLFDTAAIGPQPLRADERPMLRADDKAQTMLLTHGPLEGVSFYATRLAPGGSTGPQQYSHPGAHEIIVVVSHQVTVELNEARHVLVDGDSIDFASEYPHRMVNETNQPSLAYWLVGPAQPPFTASKE